MQIDRNAISRLLQMNDRQLETVVRRLASDYGLNLDAIGVSPDNIKGLREALRVASDQDLEALVSQLKGGRQKP